MERDKQNSLPDWNKNLIDNLAFIKKNSRYPFRQLTWRAIPRVFLLCLVVNMFFKTFLMPAIITKPMTYIALLLIILATAGVYWSIWDILRFRCIATNRTASENESLIGAFLKDQQLKYYQHPQLPELFQIISRPLGNNSRQHEVMVFIVCENKIMISSHIAALSQHQSSDKTLSSRITNLLPTTDFTPVKSRNFRKMARQLEQWLIVKDDKQQFMLS